MRYLVQNPRFGNASAHWQAGDRKRQRDDLRGRAPHARKIRQVAHDRHRVLASLLDGLLHLVELLAVAADEDDRAVLGQFKCRGATYAGGRAGDDVRLALFVSKESCMSLRQESLGKGDEM
jgi:hypothetical protein